ncbi:MAG: methionine synthase [Bacteroidetes bacterium]|nr:MAG: methionine synthase [Bacteroidota bacterium]
MIVKNIYKELEKRILILDGAMGTMIQQQKLTEEDFRGERFKNYSCDLKGNNDLLSITKPEVIKTIHKQFIEAGADIIETNTFNSNKISMQDYDMESLVYEMNVTAAKNAVEVAKKYSTDQKPIYIAGSIGPTNKTASMSPDVNDPGFRAVSFDDFVEAYSEQILGLIDGGVDLLLIETVFDILNAKAALFAINKIFKQKNVKLPVMVSVTVADISGRTLSGQTVEAFLISLSDFDLLSIGLNCSFGAEGLQPYLEELSAKAPFYVSAYPNAGLPNQFGDYDQSAKQMAEKIKIYLDKQLVNIIGGCCGTTPTHIAAFSEFAKNSVPRQIPNIKTRTQLSGLEPVIISKETNFVNVGERTNVAGSRKFARLIREKKYEEALSIARAQVDGGAQIIDVNMDDAMLDAEKEMHTFLNLMVSEPEIARLPVMIDSSKWSVIETGLKCLQGKAIVNSISLKEGEDAFIEKAEKIKNYGAAVVVMAFDEKGQAVTYNDKINICKRAYDILVNKVNFKAQNIIFDPNILTIATGIEEHNNLAVDFINATAWIKKNLTHAKVSGGVSNLSFAFRGNNIVREAMHSVFLYHAIKAGMDMAIVNPGMLQIYDEIPKKLLQLIEDVVLNRRDDATERLIEFAQNIKNVDDKKTKVADWRNSNIDDKLKHALTKGIVDYLEEDIAEALKKYNSGLEIIEGPLMTGMNYVGKLFGEGKMFLPQVVKTARVMKKSVEILQPYIEEDKGTKTKSAGKILLATVKGDVHDIGKNIVNVVWSCNNYEIIDMGVMVPTKDIIDTAIKENVDIISLSGLITPSLEEMVNVAKQMEQNKMNIPLLIGGATTSKIHTAVKIAPEYSGATIYAGDASQAVTVVNKILNNKTKTEYTKTVSEEYKQIREKHLNKKNINYISIDDARKNQLSINFDEDKPVVPKIKGIKIFDNYSVKDIKEYINWDFFFKAWELKGRFPKIFDDPKIGTEARKLFDDAQILLDNIIKNNLLKAKAVIGFFPANSINDDIEIYADETRTKILTTLHTLRQQQEKTDGSKNLSLSDFIAPKQSGISDYIGTFALTTGIDLEKQLNKTDDYQNLLFKTISDRLAEAFAELMHLKVRKEFWAYSPNEDIEKEDLIKAKFQGIRPAIGYPACPDHSEKEQIFELLNVEKNTGITLSENFAMYPTASVCGLYFANKNSKYFGLGKISKDQIVDYAKRKNISVDLAEKFLSQNLNY